MYNPELLDKGYSPLFALIEDSYIEALTSQTQIDLFSKRTDNHNVKTQILKSDGVAYLLILFIMSENDDESLEFLLDNLAESGKIIEAKCIKMK